MGNLKRRCLSCMKEFEIPIGSENDAAVCPFCGFIEHTKPKIAYHLYPGTVLNNRYYIGVVLGFGGFGVTYKAWDSTLGVVVAIKEHFPSQFVQRIPETKDVIVYSGNKEKLYRDSLDRFIEEARNTADFDNTNIVHIYNYFEENNTAYIVMEYMDGVDLKDYLKQKGVTFDKEDIDEIIIPVIKALKTIHGKGFIHRDLTPGNIRLCTNGTIKLFDFGATFFSDNEMEKTREVILTPGYAPPEQYQKKSVQGPWTDIYGLSATLYRLVTGVDPIESTNRFSDEFEKGTDQLKEPKELDPAIPGYLNDLIMKGMAIEPKLRFQTIEEFELAYLQKKRVRNPRIERRNRIIIRAVSVSAVALLIGLGAFFTARRYHKMKQKVDLDNASIEMWLPFDEAMSEEEAELFGETITSDFRNTYPNIDLTITLIREEEYNERLTEAAGNGTLPALFMSDSASDEVMAQTISVNEIFRNNYIHPEDLKFMNDYMGDIRNMHKLPTGYTVPVVYVRGSDNLNMSMVSIASLSDVEKNSGYLIDEEYAEMTAGTLLADGKGLSTAAKADALASFSEGKISYYLASTNEFYDMDDFDDVRYEMKLYETDVIHAAFSNYWSIRSGLSDAERYAAEVLLGFLTEDTAQHEMYISGHLGLPLNETTYTYYVEKVNGQLAVLDAYDDKVDFSASLEK